jgi:hypothetical protein
MSNRIVLLIQNKYFILTITTLVFIVFNLSTFISYLQTPLISGGDAPAYISAGQYYSEYIFPSVWGWIPNWFAGMPFPQFYPPLIFIITALLHKIFFFSSYVTIFKFFTLFIQVITPAVIVWLTYHLTKNKFSMWLVSILSIVFISHDALFERFDGITVPSTLNSGFIAQLLGFVLLLIWFKYFTEAKQTIQSKTLSIIFLFLILISNAHIVPIAGIYFLVTYITYITKDIYPLKIKEIFVKSSSFFLQGAVPILLAAFWYFPLYTYKEYLVTMALDIPGQLFKKGIWVFIFILFSLCIAFIRKQSRMFILSISNCIIFILLFIDLQKFIPNIPIQPDRLLATVFFISLIHVAYVLGEIIFLLNKKTKINLTPAYFILFLIALSPLINKIYKFDQNMNFNKDSSFLEVVEFLRDKDGRIHVENYFSDNTFTSFAYDAYLGLQTDGSNTLSLRESSINALFMIPLRNSLSQNLEVYGVKSYKALDKSLHLESWEENIKRAISTGTKYFIFSSSVKKYKTEQKNLLTIEKEYPQQSIFSTKEKVTFADVQKYKPVLLFSEINFKDRKANEYNYTRIQEEFFFGKMREFVLVNANNLKLDSTNDINKFETVVITTYQYDDINTAYQKLFDYSKTNDLILVFDTNPLFNKLSTLSTKEHKIKIIQKNMNPNADAIIFRKNIELLFNYLDSIKRPIRSEAQITHSKINQTNITVSLENSGDMVPILMKETYFPTWKNSNGEEVYLATPAFMLTFATTSFELNFKTDRSVYTGWIISILTFVTCTGIYIRNRNKI